jgi:hypothetical protein
MGLAWSGGISLKAHTMMCRKKLATFFLQHFVSCVGLQATVELCVHVYGKKVKVPRNRPEDPEGG